jgi:hypothetical protein
MTAAAAALAVAAAGCGSSGGGVASAGGAGGSGPSTTSSPASSSPPPTAPPVTNPLSVKTFLHHPCNLLTKARAKALGATEPGEPDNVGDPHSSGPICHWDNTDALESFSAAIIPDDTNGLDNIYRGNQDPDHFAYFVPTTVKGYPGVFDDIIDSRDDGGCGLAFAVNDHLVLDSEYTGNRETNDPCGKVKKVAAGVIETIKGES